MSRHLIRRAPRVGNRFCWGRIVDREAGKITYRLFRTAIGGRRFIEVRSFDIAEPREEMSCEVMRMRNCLRDAVDAVDFAALGIAA